MRYLILFVFVAATIAVACADRSEHVPTLRGDTESGEAAVDELYQRLVAAVEGGDAEGYADLYDADGAIIVPNHEPAAGRSAVRDWALEFLAHWRVEIDELSMLDRRITGRMGFARYHAVGRYFPAAGGAPTPFDQNYVDVFVKGADGTWRFAIHMVGTRAKVPTIWE